MKFFILFVLILTVSACQQNAAETKQINIKPSPTASAAPSASPTATVSATVTPSPNPSRKQNYNGKGVVTKIDLELVSVELDHEAIEGLMPRMIMEFYVKEKSDLEKLKVGDKVDFVLEYNAGQEKILSIKKTQ